MLKNFLSLNWLTIGKTMLKAILAAVLAYIIPLLKAGTIPGLTQIQVVGAIAIGTALSYLVKNVLTINAPNGSPLYSLNFTDIAFAFFQAVLNAVFVAFIPVLTAGTFPNSADLVTAVKAGIVTGLVYLGTNYFSNTATTATNKASPAVTPKS